MKHEIIRSLETIQDQVKQELLHVRTYRAYLAVGQAIEEISEVEEIVGSLNAIRNQVVDRLHGVREYRALLAVDKSIADISEVLGILAESVLRRAQSQLQNGTSGSQAGADKTESAPASAPAAQTEPAQQPQPTSTTVAIAADQARRSESAHRSDTDAVEHQPSASPEVMADQPPPQPEPAVETVSAAADPIHGEAAHHSDMGASDQSASVTAVTIDEPAAHQMQPSEPSAETAAAGATGVIHEADAASRPEFEAMGDPPPQHTVAMTDPSHEHQQPAEPVQETVEMAAVVPQAGAASHAEMAAVEPPLDASIAPMSYPNQSDPIHQPESAEAVASHVIDEGDAEKAKPVEIAEVA